MSEVKVKISLKDGMSSAANAAAAAIERLNSKLKVSDSLSKALDGLGSKLDFSKLGKSFTRFSDGEWGRLLNVKGAMNAVKGMDFTKSIKSQLLPVAKAWWGGVDKAGLGKVGEKLLGMLPERALNVMGKAISSKLGKGIIGGFEKIKSLPFGKIGAFLKANGIEGEDIWKGVMSGVSGIGSAISKLGGLGMSGLSAGFAGLASAASAGAAVVVAAAVAMAAAVATAVAGIGYGLAKGISEFTSFSVSVADSRGTFLNAFSVLAKSSTEGSKIYANAIKFAAATPFSTEEVVKGFQSLMVGGFKSNELERAMTAVGDLASIRGDNSLLARLPQLFGQIRGKGKLQGDELLQLAEAGLNTSDVLENIGKKMGKTKDEVLKLQSAGKIDSGVAIEAILATIEGSVGGNMNKLKTVGKSMSSLQSRPFELFSAALDATAESKTGLTGYYDLLIKIVDKVTEVFDPKSASGQQIVSTINTIGDSLVKAFGGVSVKDMGGGLQWLVEFLSNAIPVVGKFVEGFGAGAMSGIKALFGLAPGDGLSPAMWQKIGEAAKKFGEDLGPLVPVALVVAAAIGAIAAAITAMVGAFVAGSVLLAGIPGKLLGGILGEEGGPAPAGAGQTPGFPQQSPATQEAGRSWFGGEAFKPMTIPQLIPSTASGPTNNNMTVNISGSGLTPDEIVARAKTAMTSMLEKLKP